MIKEQMIKTLEHKDDIAMAVAANLEGGGDTVDSASPRLLPPSRQTSVIEAAKNRGN